VRGQVVGIGALDRRFQRSELTELNILFERYGPHVRSVPMPLKESMGYQEKGADFYLLVDGCISTLPRNLIHRPSDQRASLLQLQKESNNSFSWTITLPGTVCGFTRASYQSLATTLALYGALKAYLKEPLEFPGTRQKFGTGDDLICAALLAEFDVWAAVEEKCGGEVL